MVCWCSFTNDLYILQTVAVLKSIEPPFTCLKVTWCHWFLTPLPIEVVSIFAFMRLTGLSRGVFSRVYAPSSNEILFPYVWLLCLAFLLPFCAYIEVSNKTILTVLPHAEAKGSIYMLASLGLHLRQHCQFLMLSLFVENNFFRRN